MPVDSGPITFRITRETAGAVRYDEVDENGEFIDRAADYIIGGLYVRKHALPQPWPEALQVTVQHNG